MSDIYSVMYDGINYYKHIMSSEEEEIAAELKSLLKECLTNNWGLKGLYLKYSNEIGYYVIEDNDRGHYSMRYGFPTKEKDDAFIKLLSDGSIRKGFSFELENRESLQQSWNENCKNEYDGRKFAFEYSLDLMCEKLGYIPESYIIHYESMMNFHHNIWKYDKEKKEFICKNIDD
ncbi:hypothetical protein [Vallitalea okinawensis]|uniref:hypothetical protein n=1 Tax=Vallitalea okinawensis TaxID=2078660 RepID=UPI001300A19A|nr:hypothetical protein [Vallitalea okinawensis]